MKIELFRAPMRALAGARGKLTSCIVVATIAAASAAAPAAHAGELASPASATIVVDGFAGPTAPGVLGTVPMPIRAQPTSARWSRLMNASLDQPALARLAGRAAGLAPEQQAAFVQAAVNRAVRNGATANHCADDGYWAAAGETLTRGVGDCIDIAIAKMEALRRLGVPQHDLYLSTGYAGASRRESAALLVRIGADFWLLPEHSDRVIPAGAAADPAAGFTPVVTYGVGATWVHGRRVHAPAALAGRATVAAASARPVQTASLGN